MAILLPELPYARDALAPHISPRTIEFHYGKHHSAYVDKLNVLINGTVFADDKLEDIITGTARDISKAAVFNNAAQAWNHNFYWHSMKNGGGGIPKGELLKRIKADFGSFSKFIEDFKNAALTQFGSGWAWMVIQNGKLGVMKTLNADNPIAQGITPLLTMDVWEHAYYLDYQNKRADYAEAFIKYLINWDFVESNLEGK